MLFDTNEIKMISLNPNHKVQQKKIYLDGIIYYLTQEQLKRSSNHLLT
ncbi:hypothetical protein [Staphylococcus shinii]